MYPVSFARCDELPQGLHQSRQSLRLVATPHPQVTVVTQDRIGGPGLWLRAEPGEDTGQADALAAIVAISLAQTEAA